MTIGIFPGRFQPLHNGHMLVLGGMSKVCDEVHVAITILEDSLFTGMQVREMLSGALLQEGLENVYLHVVPESDNDSEWANAVEDLAQGKGDVTVWSGREEMIELFDGMGVETKRIVHVPGIDSDEVKDMIGERNMEWRGKVPGATVNVVTAMLGK